MKKYDFGDVKCTLAKTQRGHYRVRVEWHGSYSNHIFNHIFRTKEEALEEILSYAEAED